MGGLQLQDLAPSVACNRILTQLVLPGARDICVCCYLLISGLQAGLACQNTNHRLPILAGLGHATESNEGFVVLGVVVQSSQVSSACLVVLPIGRLGLCDAALNTTCIIRRGQTACELTEILKTKA